MAATRLARSTAVCAGLLRTRRCASLPWQGAHGGALLAPYVPSPAILTEAALDMLALRPDDVFVDLGCGDGRVVEGAARRRVLRAVGVELDAELAQAAEARVRAIRGATAVVEIVCGDLRAAERSALLSGATAIYLFLSPIAAAFVSSAVPSSRGVRIVSCDFRLPDEGPWELVESRRVLDLRLHKYVARHPEPKATL